MKKILMAGAIVIAGFSLADSAFAEGQIGNPIAPITVETNCMFAYPNNVGRGRECIRWEIKQEGRGRIHVCTQYNQNYQSAPAGASTCTIYCGTQKSDKCVRANGWNRQHYSPYNSHTYSNILADFKKRMIGSSDYACGTVSVDKSCPSQS